MEYEWKSKGFIVYFIFSDRVYRLSDKMIPVDDVAYNLSTIKR